MEDHALWETQHVHSMRPGLLNEPEQLYVMGFLFFNTKT
jgi:hypothetical protein